MADSTKRFVTGLAILAALVIGIQIGRNVATREYQALVKTDLSSDVNRSVKPTPEPYLAYLNPECGVAFEYPGGFKAVNIDETTTLFVDSGRSNLSFTLTCMDRIAKPVIGPEKTENLMISSVSAALYHDTAPKDGSALERLIFTHPRLNLMVELSGSGTPFETAVSSLAIR